MKSLIVSCIVCVACLAMQGYAQEPESAPSTLRAVQNSVTPVGKWEWEQAQFGNVAKRELILEMKNGEISGTFQMLGQSRRGPGGSNQPNAISAVEFSGDELKFDVTREFNGNSFTTKFHCVIAGDEMAGITTVSFGRQANDTAFIAKRVVADSSPSASAATESTPRESSSNENTASASSVAHLQPPTIDPKLDFQPHRIPEVAQQTDAPYKPQAILPGGVVVPLYAPTAATLKAERLREPEKYNLSSSSPGRIQSIVNIHNPSIEIHRVDDSINTGTCVILAAGGGHKTLNVGTEAADFVPFFYNYGVNTVILRNRLRDDGYVAEVDAVQDALQAIRLVRAFAADWKIDPNRIGIVGFSAGAELSGPAAIAFESFDKEHAVSEGPMAGVSSRPDFVGLLYPGPTPFTRDPETAIPRSAPPSFVATAGSGDRVHAIWAMDYCHAMLQAGIPNVELHVYGNGVHAGGLKDRNNIPFGTWQERYIDWFRDLGFLSAMNEPTKAATDSQSFVARPERRRDRQP